MDYSCLVGRFRLAHVREFVLKLFLLKKIFFRKARVADI
jgi:hypothetical protein